MRSGTCGLTFATPPSRAWTTSSLPFSPASLIAFTCTSASLLASSSACLLPLLCCTDVSILLFSHFLLLLGSSSSPASLSHCSPAYLKGVVLCVRTFASNSLNSASFCFLYVSISFLASSLASFMRLVRSIVGGQHFIRPPIHLFVSLSSSWCEGGDVHSRAG